MEYADKQRLIPPKILDALVRLGRGGRRCACGAAATVVLRRAGSVRLVCQTCNGIADTDRRFRSLRAWRRRQTS